MAASGVMAAAVAVILLVAVMVVTESSSPVGATGCTVAGCSVAADGYIGAVAVTNFMF
jgi:hypothetical protein